MVRYEHPPIYKKAMHLAIYFERIVRNFSRYHKYTLGSEMREASWEVVGLIIEGNSTMERLPLLNRVHSQRCTLKISSPLSVFCP